MSVIKKMLRNWELRHVLVRLRVGENFFHCMLVFTLLILNYGNVFLT